METIGNNFIKRCIFIHIVFNFSLSFNFHDIITRIIKPDTCYVYRFIAVFEELIIPRFIRSGLTCSKLLLGKSSRCEFDPSIERHIKLISERFLMSRTFIIVKRMGMDEARIEGEEFR